MTKGNFILLIISFIICSCSKDGFTTTSTPVYFGEDNIINLNSNKQETEVKANHPYWQMSLGYNNGSEIKGDTINGEWFTLIKKNNGEALFIKVEKNGREKRSQTIYIQNENYYTRVYLNQEGI